MADANVRRSRGRTGKFIGLQAEEARIPFANVGVVKLPDEAFDKRGPGWLKVELKPRRQAAE